MTVVSLVKGFKQYDDTPKGLYSYLAKVQVNKRHIYEIGQTPFIVCPTDVTFGFDSYEIPQIAFRGYQLNAKSCIIVVWCDELADIDDALIKWLLSYDVTVFTPFKVLHE